MPVLSQVMTAALLPRADEADIPNQQPSLWAAQMITFAFAVICFVGRMTSRWMTHNHLWWDDYFSVMAFVTNIAWCICMIIWMQHGIGIHIEDHMEMTGESEEKTLYSNKLLTFVIEMIYAYCLFFGKASILSFYWRMFKTSNIKIPILVLAGCSVIWITIRTFMGIWHCVPIRAFWDANAGGYCAIQDAHFFFGTTLTHVLIDLAILSLPVVQIRQLQLPTFQKVSVLIMFMFGSFICVAGIVLCVKATTFNGTSVDFTWNIFPIILWASVEVNLVTVSACMPVCRPALRYVVSLGNSLPSSRGHGGTSSYGKSGTYGNKSTAHKSKRRGSTTHVGKSRLDADDGASTYELANSINTNDGGDFDNHAMDGPSRTRVTVKRGKEDQTDADGIHVKSETVVTTSNVRADSPPGATQDEW